MTWTVAVLVQNAITLEFFRSLYFSLLTFHFLKSFLRNFVGKDRYRDGSEFEFARIDLVDRILVGMMVIEVALVFRIQADHRNAGCREGRYVGSAPSFRNAASADPLESGSELLHFFERRRIS